MAMSRGLQRVLWAARLVTVGLGLLVVVALLNQQSPSLLAQELPPGAERLGLPAARVDGGGGPRQEHLGDDEGILDFGTGAVTEEGDRAAQQEVAFSLDRVAQLLGWGREDDASPAEEYDPDRIRVQDWRPLDELASRGADHQDADGGGGAAAAGPSTPWQDSALLRAFIARFGVARSTGTPPTAAVDVDGGEMKDFEAAAPTAAAPAGPAAAATEPAPAEGTPLPLLAVCPMNGIITTRQEEGGAIATRVFEYAATWLVSRGVGVQWRTPLVPGAVLHALSPLFERLSVASLEQLPLSCGEQTGTAALARGGDAGGLGERDLDIPSLPTRFLDPGTPVVLRSGLLLPHLLSAQLPALREELVLRPELRQAAAAVLALCLQRVLEARGERAESTTAAPEDGEAAAAALGDRASFVAVHARRYDAALWMTAGRARQRPPPPLDADYFLSAMEHVRSELRARPVTPVFVVATDDAAWVHENLASGADGVCVHHAGPHDDAVNLAVQASCHHAILDHSAAALAALVVGPRQVDAHHPDAIVVAPEAVAAVLGSENAAAAAWKNL
ncbi:hypothetical protein ONE63_004868 [Megalurothrips usitatus]|uniref:Uncharacterized protein n=1 Tax=Megalurothrips usitatus TaxID=439358 RepID=A0AAV7X5B9_9NEOP|nr:hypothetical protein ONE63_004868 [Megalurothrips usitatus]